MERIYILDAINYLFRSYYAIGPMTNPEGQSTSALYGFIRTVQKLIREFSPKNLVCVFDGPRNKESRIEIYEQYKAHRKVGPEDLYPQIDLAVSFCKMAGIPYLMIEGYEADDVMASIALKKKNLKEIYLCTSDKDLFQLINENTFILNVHKNNLVIDSKKVEEIYGISPKQMLDLLALMGDSADNIPGVEGIGPKTAASLLREFHTLDNILENTDKISGKKGQILHEQKDLALMSKELATLITDVAIPIEDSFYTLKNPDIGALKEFYRKMHFLTLLKDFKESDEPATNKTEVKTDYQLIDTEDKLIKMCKDLDEKNELALDTETTFAHPLEAELVGIGLCAKEGKAFYIPYLGPIEKKKIHQYLDSFFANIERSFIGQNIKFDLHVLSQHGFAVKNVSFDTMIASHLINPQNRRHNLDQLALEHFDKKKIPIESLVGSRGKKLSMKDVPLHQIAEYCCEDVDYTFRLKKLFTQKLKEKKLEDIFQKIELPLLPVLAKMEKNGIFLDTNQLKTMSKALNQELKILEKEIYQEVGREFNIKSPKQLSEALFIDLGLKCSKMNKAPTSTAAKVLEELAEEAPVVSKVLEFRALEKLRSTYTESLIDERNPNTGRIHCTFNQAVTATGRLSCQNPNLQNIPVRSDRGRKIRGGFKPEKSDWVYLSFDYSQIELRLLAHFSKDAELIKAFRAKEDIHTHTASIVFDVPIEKVTKKMRSQAKTVNFGLLYGQGSFGLSKQLGISTKEAKSFIETYFDRYKNIKNYFDKCIQEVQEKGYSTTITGRRRPIPEINNKNSLIRSAAERLAINSPLQGSNADIIKIAMIEINKEMEKKALQGFLILQIHDELLFEVPEKEIEIFKKMVKEKMENAIELAVPLEIVIAVGKNWGEC